jgi:hypothetical protein
MGVLRNFADLRQWPKRTGILCLLLILSGGSKVVGQALPDNRVPRVLVLYPYDERVAATTVAGEAIRTRLLDVTGGKIDLFSEFLDLARFPEEDYIERMAQFLAVKYTDRHPDVVIALGEQSAKFIVTHRVAFAGDAKIIVAGFNKSTAQKLNLPPDVIGAFTEFNIIKTAALARRLHPSARHLFVLGGSSEFDQWWLETAKADLAEFSKDYDTTYLEDLTIEEFVANAAAFPPDSIALALTIFKDRSGRNFIPREAIKEITATASAPIFAPYSTYIDYGSVGGNVVTFEALGETVADLTLDALDGKPITHVQATFRRRRCPAT